MVKMKTPQVSTLMKIQMNQSKMFMVPVSGEKEPSTLFRGFIFAPYGPYWKFLKKTVVSELLNSKTLDSLLPKAKVGESVELEGDLMKMANNIISRMLMSKRCSDENDDAGDIKSIVTDIGELMFTFNLSDHIWFLKNIDVQGIGKRSKEIRGRFDSLIEKIIDKPKTREKITSERR
ncbi:hypothetical protein LXL04_014065 [Taraxacum kok-saghyz]